MIQVLHPGLYTSIQDLGRLGYRHIGVPTSGPMDTVSAELANALLNNDPNDALMEITMLGPRLHFLEAATMVLTGAEMSARINDKVLLTNKPYTVASGDILSFGRLRQGMRCYLAVKGGFSAHKVMGSRSMYAGITESGRLKAHEVISFVSSNALIEPGSVGKGRVSPHHTFFHNATLPVYKGPEFDLFSARQQSILTSRQFTVSNHSDRMGYQLNEAVFKHRKSMITSPVLPGTVQLTPAGKLVILMKDAQTTGGYPRIFQLPESSLAMVAQKKPGDPLGFGLL
ncbi:MAG: biotin-dependent carboxyltransferase family protein [Lutibacter sp.]|nr:biotin-dependent carboxyltransferase family protein [Lutibacter sp.]